MHHYTYSRDDNGKVTVKTPLRGAELLNDPLYNKSTAFTLEERDSLGLHGLLPAEVNTLEQQAARIYGSIHRKPDLMEKYIGLASLQDRNEYLYYRLLIDHFEELMPVVYTPTVGQACKDFSKVFRRGRGLWITPADKGRIAEILRNARYDNVRLIVATDNEAILGIGDQGAGGMAISVGKLSLYCAGAGINPAETLPISLDVGTNNPELLESPLYLGRRHPRLTGPEYDSLVEEFVDAVKTVFPGALIQWEDFRKDNALNILERYRHDVLSFNDDIQGTGAVALSGLLTACNYTHTSIAEQRILIYGAGAAGMGIAAQLKAALSEAGVTGDKLASAVAVMDSGGLLTEERNLRDAYKRDLAWPAGLATQHGIDPVVGNSLEMVIDAYKPTCLIGSSGQAGAFNETVVRTLIKHVERPVIMPFSNPTSCCEALPENIVEWTNGQALIATGSPFEPVKFSGGTLHIGQGNNVFIFPGLGLGALLAGATTISDSMITASAKVLATHVDQAEFDLGLLYPAIPKLRGVSAAIAAAVIRTAISEGLATNIIDDAEIDAVVEQSMWTPIYPDVVPA